MAGRKRWDLVLAAGFAAGTISVGTAPKALAQGTIPGLTSTPITFSGHADAFAAGPDGNVWLVDSAANAVGRLAVDGTAYKTFTVPTPSAGLQSITVGPDGNLWFTESTAAQVGRITTSGAITEFAVPGSFHFAFPVLVATGSIFPGPDGNLWISGQGQMARVTPQGIVTVVTVPPPQGVALLSIGKCVVGSDNNFWCQSAGNDTVDHTAMLTTSGAVTLYPAQGQAFDFVEGPDGNVWYVSQGTPPESLTRITPAGVETVYTLPTHSLVEGLAVGADGNLWFTERSTMGNIWQVILSSATDDGHATFNSAPITASYPEAIIPVASAVHASGIHTEQATANTCPPGEAFYVSNPVSFGENLTWVRSSIETTCTDLMVQSEPFRYGYISATIMCGCSDNLDPMKSPNPAQNPVFTLELPPFSTITKIAPTIWTDCNAQGSGTATPEVICNAPGRAIVPGEFFFAVITADLNTGKATIKCVSDTPDTDPSNNSRSGSILNVVGVFLQDPPTVNTPIRGTRP